MHKYFKLDTSAEIKSTGTFPQVSCSTQFEAHQLKYNEAPGFAPSLSFKLEKRAKITDVLSQAAISADGLIVSEKVKRLLSNFKLIEHFFYPIEIEVKTDLQYYWLHLVAPLSNLDWVDFTNSSFFLKKGLRNIGEVALSSIEDYKEKKKEQGSLIRIKASKLVLGESFNRSLDLFVLPRFGTSIYISEKLKSQIIENNISGIELHEATEIELG